MKNLIGTSIGQHEIVAQLGRGGMANVYKAFHPGLSVHRAIKVIRPELADSEGFQDRFQREARAVAALRHPNIVQIHDFGQHDDLFYMIMEFVEGEDLKARMLREGAIRPFSEAVRLIEQIAEALGYAHSQGVVHRDVKPDNVLLNKNGQAILADFGIAKIISSEDAKLTATGTGLGTPAYMAPEQAKGAVDVDEMADLYAVGVVLYEMLTAHLPFHADTPLAVLQRVIYDPVTPPREFTADIPDALQGVVLKAMAKDPARRYPDASALIEAAKQSLAGGEGGAGSMVPPVPVSPPLAPTAAVTEGGTVILSDSTGTAGSGGAAETRPVAEPEGSTVAAEGPAAATTAKSRGPLIAAIAVLALFLILGVGAVFGGLWWFSNRISTAEEKPSDLAAFFDEGAAEAAEFSGSADEEEGSASAAGAEETLEEPESDAVVSENSAETGRPAETGRSPETGRPAEGGPVASAPAETKTAPRSGASTPPQEREQSEAPDPESAGADWRNRRAGSPATTAVTPVQSTAEPSAQYLGRMRFGRAAHGEVEPEEPVEFDIEVKRPTTFYFDIVTANRRAIYTLLGPDGQQIFREEGSDVGPLQLDQPGLYTLRVETDGGVPIQFEVKFAQIGS